MKVFLTLVSSVLLSSCGTQSSSKVAAELEYLYDASTGLCLNAAGEQGLNPLDGLQAREPGFVGECGDFRGQSLGGIMDGVNFRGADFTGANFTFATGTDIDFSGAKVPMVRGGYNFFSNIIYDQFSQIDWYCKTLDNGRLNCEKP
jgi:uncharacterized protein YjbI with pentapeptide repeats